MKIEKIIINNFRIFNGRHEFNFKNKDLVVISGPNGNGKSTIFDSIQWCFTGKIPRYEGSNERQKFNYIMNESIYKDSDNQIMYVEILLSLENGTQHKICRAQKKNRGGRLETPEIIIDDLIFNISNGSDKIRDILSSIEIEDTNVTGQDKIMNLSTFFSSTQLLSQDALHNFIRADKPSERYKLIDKVLGVRKYGEDFEHFIELAKGTAHEMLNLLIDELSEPKEELDRLNIQIVEKEELLASIGEFSENDLLKELRDIVSEFKKECLMVPESTISFQQLDGELIENLGTFRREANLKKEEYEQLKMRLQDSTELMTLTPEDYLTEKNLLDQTYLDLNKKIERRKQGMQIIKSRQVTMELLKIRRERYQECVKEYNILSVRKSEIEKEQKLAIMHEAFVKTKKHFSDLDAFSLTYEKRQLEQHDVDTYIKFYELSESEQILKKEILEGKTVLKENRTNLDAKDIELKGIIEKIKEININISEKKTSIVEELIRQVQGHLVHRDGGQICPICGTDFESAQSLNDSISNQIDKGTQMLSEMEKRNLDLREKKSVYEEEIRKQSLGTKQLEKSLEKKEEQVYGISFEKEVVRALLPKSHSNLDIVNLREKKLDNEKFLFDYKLAFELHNALKLNQIELHKLDKEIQLKLQVLNNLKQESKRWAIYLEMEETKIDKKLQLISNYFTKVREEQVKHTQEINSLIQGSKTLVDRWIQRDQKIMEFQRSLPSFTGKPSELEEWLQNVNKQINIISLLNQKLGAHLSKVQIFLSTNQVIGIKTNVSALTIQVRELENHISSLNEFIVNDLEYLRKEHISVQSDLIGDYLMKHSDYIDQLFMQISPHAMYRHVQLVPKEKNLYVVMARQSAKEYDLRQLDEDKLKQQFNASLTFSSGQSNVLAICIFLALNRSQKWTKLKILGIDDPFQNLDDINVFSFIDVLSQVISTQNKQVLISTHSDDFAHLIRVKMELEPEQIGTIVFQSYSEQGAVVTGNCVSIVDAK